MLTFTNILLSDIHVFVRYSFERETVPFFTCRNQPNLFIQHIEIMGIHIFFSNLK